MSIKIFTENERIVIGLIYSVVPIIILPVHFLLLIIFMKYPEYRKSTAYKIMFSIGIADCLQTIAHFYSGIITLKNSVSGSYFEKFMGGLINAAWLAVVPQGLVLALNRLDVFRTTQLKQSSDGYIFPILLFLSWIFGGIYFVLYLTDYTGIVYNRSGFYWEYDSGNWSETLGNVEYYTTIPILLATFLIYLLVIGVILMMKKSKTTKSMPGTFEIRLLIQAVFVFIYSVLIV
uniref:Uncharacterized protein n=1 Tax=Panagrolaimus sp. JU765 TaxID=591449 RepID=A0AC34RJL2_9BILA